MTKITFTILTVFFISATIYAQPSPFHIQSRCKGTNSVGSVTVSPTSIFHKPCPDQASVFSGNVDFGDATIRPPFRLLDKSFLNFQGYDSYFSIGNNPAQPISLPNDGLYLIDVEPELRGDGTATGVFSRISISSPVNGSYSPTTGVFGIVQNPGDRNVNRELIGVEGYAYQRSALGSASATGGSFTAVTGGNLGGINPTPLYGVRSTAYGGHNGTSPLVVGVYSNVSNLGGGGVGNIIEGIALHARFDGGYPITNYATAKGLALQGWGPANGGTYTNSYGIYADSSIDRGTADRYFIYSLSTSPSLFSGAVRVAQDVYVTDSTKGIVLQAPDNTCYRFTVANGGSLNVGTVTACP